VGEVGKKKKKQTNPATLHKERNGKKNKEYREMDNFYYTCLYDILQKPEHRATRTEKVNRLKAQLIKAYREQRQG
jgi:hypothetical protein